MFFLKLTDDIIIYNISSYLNLLDLYSLRKVYEKSNRCYEKIDKYLYDIIKEDKKNRLLKKKRNDTIQYPEDFKIYELVCAIAAEKGNLDLIKWIKSNSGWDELIYDSIICGFIYYSAINGGHMEIIKYAHEHKCKWSTEICAKAAENGFLECLKYLHENGCPWDEETCKLAALNGNYECLKYAYENGCPWNTNKMCKYAVKNRSIYGKNYALYKIRPEDHKIILNENMSLSKYISPWGKYTIINKSQKIDCLKYAHENGCPWNEEICMFAALHNYLDCLRYAHENGCPWNEQVCAYAALHNSLDCLRYAHENGCPWDSKTCYYSVCNGNNGNIGSLDCLKYACDNGCPLDCLRICATAAGNGYLECLKYAHKSGCPWDIMTICFAIEYKHYECLKYAHLNGCPGVDIEYDENGNILDIFIMNNEDGDKIHHYLSCHTD